MKTVNFNPIGKSVEVHTDERVLDAFLAQKLDIPMACGGKGLCATCHCWVEKGHENLTPMTDREKRTLGLVTGADSRSRLSCQARIIGEPIEITLPEGMFIETTGDLESLIGKRAMENILHPIDMRILIAKGKIITKSRILQLKDVDVDMDKMRAEAAKIKPVSS